MVDRATVRGWLLAAVALGACALTVWYVALQDVERVAALRAAGRYRETAQSVWGWQEGIDMGWGLGLGVGERTLERMEKDRDEAQRRATEAKTARLARIALPVEVPQ